MNDNINAALKSPQRIANPLIVSQLERTIERLRHTVSEYLETALPNTLVDMNLNQAILTLSSIRKDLHLT